MSGLESLDFVVGLQRLVEVVAEVVSAAQRLVDVGRRLTALTAAVGMDEGDFERWSRLSLVLTLVDGPEVVYMRNNM